MSTNLEDFDYLKELGYSDKEIEDYSKSWADDIKQYLIEYKDEVVANMKYLQPYFKGEEDLLLKLPIFYASAFTMSEKTFKERIE